MLGGLLRVSWGVSGGCATGLEDVLQVSWEGYSNTHINTNTHTHTNTNTNTSTNDLYLSELFHHCL